MYRSKKKTRLSARSAGFLLVGGCAGGLAGAISWAVVELGFGFEGRWLACGVGFLVGVGVRYAAWKVDIEESTLEGCFAAAIALVAIVGAKSLFYWDYSSRSSMRGTAPPKTVELRMDEEGVIAMVADDIVIARSQRGEAVSWPPGKHLTNAARQQDYPPDIWAQAAAQWKTMTPLQRSELVNDRASMKSAREAAGQAGFHYFFSPLDIVWVSLAVITAYKIGVGTYGMDD